MSTKKKILFVAEGVTLAHIGRALVLAQLLDSEEYEIYFSCDPRYEKLLKKEKFKYLPIQSLSSEVFLMRVAEGKPIYLKEELEACVREDLEMLHKIQPELVVSDFRISLSIAARKLGIPFFNVTNAHWSPRVKGTMPIPENQFFRKIGWGPSLLLMKTFGRVFVPLALRFHAKSMNEIRKQYGLPKLRDIREVYTDADFNLYVDTPNFIPLRSPRVLHAASAETFLGPVLWSPEIPKPQWWNQLKSDVPLIYLTLGSSGNTNSMPILLEALKKRPVQVMISTAGRVDLPVSENFFIADYLPGVEAAKRSHLVICNGGSGTVYQALSVGTPVFGVISNLDQAWTMLFAEKHLAGRSLRHWQMRSSLLDQVLDDLLSNPKYRAGAQRICDDFKQWDVKQRFENALQSARSLGMTHKNNISSRERV